MFFTIFVTIQKWLVWSHLTIFANISGNVLQHSPWMSIDIDALVTLWTRTVHDGSDRLLGGQTRPVPSSNLVSVAFRTYTVTRSKHWYIHTKICQNIYILFHIWKDMLVQVSTSSHMSSRNFFFCQSWVYFLDLRWFHDVLKMQLPSLCLTTKKSLYHTVITLILQIAPIFPRQKVEKFKNALEALTTHQKRKSNSHKLTSFP